MDKTGDDSKEFMGLQWYWWLAIIVLIIAVVAAFWWYKKKKTGGGMFGSGFMGGLFGEGEDMEHES